MSSASSSFPSPLLLIILGCFLIIIVSGDSSRLEATVDTTVQKNVVREASNNHNEEKKVPVHMKPEMVQARIRSIPMLGHGGGRKLIGQNDIIVEDVCSRGMRLSSSSISEKCSNWWIWDFFDVHCSDDYRVSDNYHELVHVPLKEFIFGQDAALDNIRNIYMQRLSSIDPITGQMKISKDSKQHRNKDTEFSRPIVYHFVGDNGNGKSLTVQTFTELMYKSYHGRHGHKAVLVIDGLDYKPPTLIMNDELDTRENINKQLKIRENHANRLIRKIRGVMCNHIKKYTYNGIIVIEEIQKMMAPVFNSLESLFYGSMECHPEHLIEETELRKLMQSIYNSKSPGGPSVSDQLVRKHGDQLIYNGDSKGVPDTPNVNGEMAHSGNTPYNRQYKLKTADIIVIMTSDLGKEDATRNKTETEFQQTIHERIKTYTGIDNFNKYIKHIPFRPLERQSIEKILEREIYLIFCRESLIYSTQFKKQYFNGNAYQIYIQYKNIEEKQDILNYLSGVWHANDHLRKMNGRSINNMITVYIHPLISGAMNQLADVIYSIKETYTENFLENCPHKSVVQFFYDKEHQMIRTTTKLPLTTNKT